MLINRLDVPECLEGSLSSVDQGGPQELRTYVSTVGSKYSTNIEQLCM